MVNEEGDNNSDNSVAYLSKNTAIFSTRITFKQKQINRSTLK